MKNTHEERQTLVHKLFPDGIPWLWCPPLTHFKQGGGIDLERMSAHFQSMSPRVGGFLIPGTTGEGWELNEEESLLITEFAMRWAQENKTKLLLGALRTDLEAVKRMISLMMTLIDKMSPGKGDPVDRLGALGVVGFAVCPPKGKSLTQTDLEDGLSTLLAMGLPMALYQLPYMTENEVSPETFERLAHRYTNLIFFKDSSGRDLIAASGVDKAGVFLVRGGEGDYARWPKAAGGPYDGFLLSVGNSFSRELTELMQCLEAGDAPCAAEISERVTKALFGTIALVKRLPTGGVYTNANKAIDHFYAYGPAAATKEGPMLKGGTRIPGEILSATGDVLRACQLMPEKGYLA